LRNINTLPFFITATCDFAPFDNPTINSAGENLIMNSKGGSVSVISTTRVVYISNNGEVVREFYNHFFDKKNGKYLTLGELANSPKNRFPTYDNSRKFVLLGDPALTLNFPTLNVVTTEINNAILSATDTIKSLQKVTIKGEVRDAANQIMSNFNGVCYPSVLDKSANILTLRNDNPSLPAFGFQSQKNLVFKGKATVTNGKFEYTFIVPKDIDYNFGSCKISYYAESATNGVKMDGNGVTTSILLGGAANNGIIDNQAPVVNLYMGDENFAFGGTTSESPTILAKLSDDNGINTIGNGIGHDITAIIDEKSNNAIVLNNFYETEANDYKKGRVKYDLYKLTEGTHTLKVKAWDINNNPGEGYTEFVVSKSASLAINHLLNYPNPFINNTCFQFEHNKAGELLDVTIQIFSISGKLVKNIHQTIQPTSFRTNKDICWDGNDEYGDPIGKGVYIYKVFLKDEAGNTAADYQKMVLLK
jgi:hypothetical protein